VRLGPFLLEQPAGEGGMGVVWSARHPADDVPVAIKVLRGPRAQDPTFTALFRREIRAVAALDHRHVVAVHDHGVVDDACADASGGRLVAGSPWLAMAWVPGGSLQPWCGRLPWSGVREVLERLLSALAHAHARGVLHRDLKPSNVLGGGDPRALCITDFGLAAADEVVRGTPAYMAPEQVRGDWRDQGPWTDLYGLGCLGWALVTGAPPFADPDLLRLLGHQVASPPPRLAPAMAVPEGLEGWLVRLLAKDPGARFDRAADAAWALARLGQVGAAPVATSTPAPEPDATLTAVALPAFSPQALPLVAPAPVVRPEVPADWRGVEGRRAPELRHAGLGLVGLRTVRLVGREAARDRLWRLMAEPGTARVLVLEGPAGCGKSRLCTWLARRVHETGAGRVLAGTPAQGLPGLVRDALGLAGLGYADARDRVVRLLAERVPEAVAESLAAWACPPTDDQVLAGAPRLGWVRPAERHHLVAQLVGALGQERPVLLWLDDVHAWVEGAALLAWLQDRDLPVVAVATARAEALAEQDLARATLGSLPRLTLGPLPADEHRALVRGLLGLEGPLVARVAERTAGNPLFAVHLIGDWVDRGLLVPASGGFALAPDATVALPDVLNRVWVDRITRVLGDWPVHARDALEVGAALGREVRREEWSAVCADLALPLPEALLERLFELALVTGDPTGDWAFVHGMLQEAVAGMAESAGRAVAWHRACAGHLADRSGQGIAERRGHHLVAAGDPLAALAPLFYGAHDRITAGEFDAVDAVVAERTRLLEGLGIPPSDPRWGLQEHLTVRAEIGRGHFDGAHVLALASLARSEGPGWEEVRVNARLDLGRIARQRGLQLKAWRHLRRGEQLAEREGLGRLVARCREVQGWVLFDRGKLARARERFQSSLEVFAGLDYRLGHAVCLLAVSAVDVRVGRPEASRAGILQARELYALEGDRWGLASCATQLGEVLRGLGDLAGAEEAYAESLARYQAIGSAMEVIPRINLGLVRFHRDDLVGARAAFEACRELLQAQGRRSFLAAVEVSLVAVSAGEGDWAAWDRHWAAAQEHLAATGFVDPDLAGLAERAAALALVAGQAERAAAAAALAAGQRAALTGS